MDWKDVGKMVAKAAPILGTVLGGPAVGAATGGVVSMISSALGIEPDETTPANVAAMLGADPEAMLKLKEMELNHKVELEKLALEGDRLEIEKDKAYLADIQNSRTRQVESEKATGKKDWALYLLAYAITGGFFATLLALIAFPGLATASPALLILLGSLGTGFGQVLGYFFGSSKSSSDKNKMIASMGTGDGRK